MTTRDGRMLRRREQINLGNGERPLSETEILEKFRSNALRAVPQAQAERIEGLVLSIDETADISELVASLMTVERNDHPA